MKIPSTTRTQKYECTYLIPVGLTTDEQKSVTDKVAALIKKLKGSLITTEDWGKKVLAYTIKKEGKRHTEALYTHLVIEFPTSSVSAFDKDLYLIPELIRHLVVIAVETDGPNSSAVESTEVVQQ